jgi:DnaJ-class molecular chaperone
MIIRCVKDYYRALSLDRDASYQDIKTSFRKLALKYHPDKNKNSEESKKKFMYIVEAYEVLSNESSRKKYDQSLISGTSESRLIPKWSPSSDFKTVYSYSNLKNRSERGGMWDISQTANRGMWKATAVLFVALGIISILIFILS